MVAIPQNLCVKIPANADLKKAAYNTLGSISLQGIRQADLRIGEVCTVVGLGLIGHLTCLILRAGGIKVIGIDIDPRMVEIASKYCTDLAFVREEEGLIQRIVEFTGGIGVDAVIITAATESLDPVNFAGKIARKKGKVVIVGDVPTGFDREPDYYRKELELRMSCSYGPGRYDLNYEEKGLDYPTGYVRWTENRNMQAFQDLVHSGKIGIDYLTTHIFDLEKASEAYDLILNKEEPYLGILIRYDVSKDKEKSKKIFVTPPASLLPPHAINISFIGAGSYAMSHLLPNIPKEKDVVLKGVMTSSGTSSRTVAERYRFEFCTSDEKDILNNQDINTVFIATRHNTHAEYILKSLKAGKHVFVEKPLCLTFEELSEIESVYSSLNTQHSSLPLLMVGFNRRFSPLTDLLKKKLGGGPMSMIYRINAGQIPSDSWIQDQEIGGGRIVGEVCHFIDFLTYINGSLPDSVYASALPDPSEKEDTVNISLNFKNGSIGTISYFSNGSKSLFKEYVEVYKAGVTAVLKDFKELEVYGGGKPFKKSLTSQDKGQKMMVKAFIDSIKNGKPSPIPFEEIYTVSLTTFKVIESIRTKQAVKISPYPLSPTSR
jgi:predicted dehydrogenase/NADPH:quinone reductase-like Zn-dependent oxidoreductase